MTALCQEGINRSGCGWVLGMAMWSLYVVVGKVFASSALYRYARTAMLRTAMPRTTQLRPA